MEKTTTAARLQQLMDERGLRQVDILSATEPYCKKYNVKLGRNALSQYVSGKVAPRQDKLTILGLALNVSEAWLMGYDVPMERKIAPTAKDDERNSEAMDLFVQLNDEQQATIISVMKGFLGKQ